MYRPVTRLETFNKYLNSNSLAFSLKLIMSLDTPSPVRGTPHTSAYVSIRQHTSAYVSMRQHTCTGHCAAFA